MTRKEIMQRAVDECFREMYAKAQPSADFDALIEGKKNGTIIDTDEDPIYRRYYLSQEEFMYIRAKYIEAYRFNNEFNSNLTFIEDCFKEGGYRDCYSKDETGRSFRTSEKTETLEELIGEENAIKVFKLLNDFKNFYRFDREESDFTFAVTLGASPNSNAETVTKYWREHGMPDFTIEERDPESFWYRDEYGENWKQILDEENAEIEAYNNE